MLHIVKTPKIISSVLRGYIWHFSRQKKELYLTFDDGPIPKITPWVLDRLKEVNAKATFFCVGENVKAHPEIFNRILKEGHSIGNHTFDHLNGLKTSTKHYIENIEKTKNCFLKNNTTFFLNKNLLFRPPYGKISPRQTKIIKTKDYKIVLWDVLSRDYDTNLSRVC